MTENKHLREKTVNKVFGISLHQAEWKIFVVNILIFLISTVFFICLVISKETINCKINSRFYFKNFWAK